MTHILQWRDWTMIGGEVTERRAEVGPLCYAVQKVQFGPWEARLLSARIDVKNTRAEVEEFCQAHLDGLLSACSVSPEAADGGWVEVFEKPSDEVIRTHEYQIKDRGDSVWYRREPYPCTKASWAFNSHRYRIRPRKEVKP